MVAGWSCWWSVVFFSWHEQQQYSSSQPVFVFTTIGPVTGPSSSLVDVGSGEAIESLKK
jgi:hypothetical protein